MKDYYQEIIQKQQNECELVEIGAVHAAGKLIEEMYDAVQDEVLTLAGIKTMKQKFEDLLKAVDNAKQDLECQVRYFGKSEEADRDNHK